MHERYTSHPEDTRPETSLARRYCRSFWSAPVFSGALGSARHITAPRQKRQKGQPHSTTLARDPHTPSILAKLLEFVIPFFHHYGFSDYSHGYADSAGRANLWRG